MISNRILNLIMYSNNDKSSNIVATKTMLYSHANILRD